MRYPGDHKNDTRLRIVDVAASAIRAKGPDGIAVADIMAGAGLTHGGFYAHFKSKDALVNDAVEAMFVDALARTVALAEAQTNGAIDLRGALRSYLTSYLSPRHRDESHRGCPLPALSADMARNSGRARIRFSEGLEALTSQIKAVLGRLGIADPQREARAVVAQIVGAVALARAVGQGTESDAILSDTLAVVLARLGL
jgi:TetR/AcrR family transcriptional repressor of nem operon